MRYHLDTIPVWDAFKQDEYCPFCSLFRKREVIHVDRTLGGAVMEPDTRIRVNEQGFCPEHHRQLYALQNRLGHALIMESHLKVLTEKAERILASGGSKGGFFKKDDKPRASQQLMQLTGSCIICDSIRNDMAQYAFTAALLFEKDAEFRQAFENAHLCLEHVALLTQAGEEHLSSAARGRFFEALLKMLRRDSEKLQKDISAFAKSFDYRNAANTDVPKAALEKAVNFSRTRCLGSDPANEKNKRN